MAFEMLAVKHRRAVGNSNNKNIFLGLGLCIQHFYKEMSFAIFRDTAVHHDILGASCRSDFPLLTMRAVPVGADVDGGFQFHATPGLPPQIADEQKTRLDAVVVAVAAVAAASDSTYGFGLPCTGSKLSCRNRVTRDTT